MTTYHVKASRVIPAPPETVYAVLIDYEEGHRAILPKPYFVDMIIEKGGRCRVTIASEMRPPPGLRGFIERLALAHPREPLNEKVIGRITSYNVCYTKLLRQRRSDKRNPILLCLSHGRLRSLSLS